MAVHRLLEKPLQRWLHRNKVLVIFGTRRVGKTVLIHELATQRGEDALVLNGEDMDIQELLARRSAANYRQIVGNRNLVVIDEAQAVPEIGNVLKLMIDSLPGITIIASGSSAFDLSNQTGEPLIGRSLRFQLHPFTNNELRNHYGFAAEYASLRDRLLYGCYPEVVTAIDYAEKEMYLKNLVQDYLLKDILAYEGVKNANKLASLLRLVAFQVGAEVSYQELGTQLGLSRVTVESYLDLLSKVFILFKLPAYSTNPRKEISKGAKWYFYDTGVRNALIGDFRQPGLRPDLGALWENFVVSEFKKLQETAGDQETQFYFWRSYNQQEVDLVQVHEKGELKAYEIKWKWDKPARFLAAFRTAYPQASLQMVHIGNFFDYFNEPVEIHGV
ncbi:MAG: ATP-binding protein [Bacteroidia bacterium]